MAAAAEHVQEQTRDEGRATTKSLVKKMAERFGVDDSKLLHTLKQTAFRQRRGPEPTNEQMMALLVVADQYNLNPFTREIYAFPDSDNGIVPVVGVDGWARIINEHSQFDGLEFDMQPREEWESIDDDAKPAPAWMSVTIYRKDRRHPITITEYLDEVYRPPFVKNKGTSSEWKKCGPWQTHTKRQLRHKTLIQGARVAFSFVGIYDEDEAERIIEGEATRVVDTTAAPVVTTAEGEPQLRAIEDKTGKATGLMDALFQQSQSQPQATPDPVPAKPEAADDEQPAQGTFLDQYEEEAARA